MEFINFLKVVGHKVALKSPYAWFLSWYCLNNVKSLLPHDNSYYGILNLTKLNDKNFILDIGANTFLLNQLDNMFLN